MELACYVLGLFIQLFHLVLETSSLRNSLLIFLGLRQIIELVKLYLQLLVLFAQIRQAVILPLKTHV